MANVPSQKHSTLFSFYLPDDLKEKLIVVATKERRSLAGMIRLLLYRGTK